MSEITDIEIKKMTKEQNYIRGYQDGRKDLIEKITGKINGVYGVFLQCIPKDEILDELLDTIDKEKAESEGKTIEENGNM